MLAEGGEHPVILREAVTSPAGTTIMAIRETGAPTASGPRCWPPSKPPGTGPPNSAVPTTSPA